MAPTSILASGGKVEPRSGPVVVVGRRVVLLVVVELATVTVESLSETVVITLEGALEPEVVGMVVAEHEVNMTVDNARIIATRAAEQAGPG